MIYLNPIDIKIFDFILNKIKYNDEEITIIIDDNNITWVSANLKEGLLRAPPLNIYSGYNIFYRAI